MPPTTPIPPAYVPICVCKPANPNGVTAQQCYFKTFEIFCPKCECCPPNTVQMLRALKGLLYTTGLTGTARAGKSTTSNRTTMFCVDFMPADKKPQHIEEFEESNASEPKTKLIQVMPIPMYFDRDLNRTTTQMGTLLLADSEGMNLGDTTLHGVILKLLVRMVTCVLQFEMGAFSFRSLDGIALLVTQGLFGRGETPAAAMNEGAGQRAGLCHPALGLVLNKATVELEAGQTPLQYWKRQLEHSTLDERNNTNRRLITDVWKNPDDLFGAFIKQLPFTDEMLKVLAELQGLTGDAAERFKAQERPRNRQQFDQAFGQLVRDLLKHTVPFTVEYATGTAGRGVGNPLDGNGYADYIEALVKDCLKNRLRDKFDQPSVSAAFRDSRLKALETQALEQYDKEVTASALLKTGVNKYDGARTYIADDDQVQAIVHEIELAHQSIATKCEDMFNQGATGLAMVDPDGTNGRIVLNRLKDVFHKQKWIGHHKKHFDHMRSVDKFNIEYDYQNKTIMIDVKVPAYPIPFIPLRIGSETIPVPSFHSTTRHREVKTRFNGDVVISEWSGGPTE